MITAYRIQIAVPLASTQTAQTALDLIQPNVWAFYPEPGAVLALVTDPTTPTHAVGSGKVSALVYAQIAAIAVENNIYHLPVAQWEDDGEGEYEVELDGVVELWDQMGLVPPDYGDLGL